MINLDKALEPIREMVENERYSHAGAYTYRGELRERWRNGDLGKDETCVNLRLDWELNEDITENVEIAQLMIDALKADLEDLIVNGDAIQVSDPLIKMFNGERVRGQKAVEVVILAAHLEKEYKPKKKSIEYTLFFRPYIRWE